MNDWDTFMDGFTNYIETIRKFESLLPAVQKNLIESFKKDTNLIITAMEKLKHEN